MLTCIIGAYGPLYNVVIERIYPANIRAFLLSKSKIFLAISGILGSLLAGYLMELKIFPFDAWRIVFFFGYFIYLGNFIICFNRLKVQKVEGTKPNTLNFLKESFKLLKEDKRNTWFIVSGFFFTSGLVITNTVVPMYQNDIMHIGPKEVGILLFIQNIFWMVGYPIYGKYITKKGVIKGWVLTVFLALMLPFGYIISFNNWVVLFAFYAFTGLFTTGNDMAKLSIILKTANPEKLTQYQSLHCFFLAIRGIVALGVSALIVGFGEKLHLDLRILFGISILIIVISLVIFLKIFKNYKE